MSAISVSIGNAAIEPDVQSPKPPVEPVAVTLIPPVRRSPKRTLVRRRNPRSRNPVVALLRVVPVPRRPLIVCLRQLRLLVLRQRRRGLICVERLLPGIHLSLILVVPWIVALVRRSLLGSRLRLRVLLLRVLLLRRLRVLRLNLCLPRIWLRRRLGLRIRALIQHPRTGLLRDSPPSSIAGTISRTIARSISGPRSSRITRRQRTRHHRGQVRRRRVRPIVHVNDRCRPICRIALASGGRQHQSQARRRRHPISNSHAPNHARFTHSLPNPRTPSKL